MRRLGGITDHHGHELSQLQEMVKDREAWCSVVYGIARVRYDLETKYHNKDFMIVSVVV